MIHENISILGLCFFHGISIRLIIFWLTELWKRDESLS